MNSVYKIGIDEVGRGPVAGPVAACVFFIESEKEEVLKKIFREKVGVEMTDSKKLTEKRREKLFDEIKNLQEKNTVFAKVTFLSASDIDNIGIIKSLQKCIDTSLKNLLKDPEFQNKYPKVTPEDIEILLDGGLKAPKEYTNQKTIIRGDQKEFSISCASVVAKVVRDHYMQNLGEKNPIYGFENHKGYGTKKHLEAIQAHGATEYHRKSFLKKYV